MEIAHDDPFQTDPVRQDQGSHAHLARSEAAGQDALHGRSYSVQLIEVAEPQ